MIAIAAAAFILFAAVQVMLVIGVADRLSAPTAAGRARGAGIVRAPGARAQAA